MLDINRLHDLYGTMLVGWFLVKTVLVFPAELEGANGIIFNLPKDRESRIEIR